MTDTATRPITGYHIPLTCRHCGDALTHTASGAVYAQDTSALAACTGCGSKYHVQVRFTVLDGPAIRATMPAEDAACRNPQAVGAPLIALLLEAQR